jgi:hypothetical protein
MISKRLHPTCFEVLAGGLLYLLLELTGVVVYEYGMVPGTSTLVLLLAIMYDG